MNVYARLYDIPFMTLQDIKETLSMHKQKPLRITKGNNSHRIDPLPLFFIINICPVYMKVYARFGEILSKTLKDLKETKCYGRTDG